MTKDFQVIDGGRGAGCGFLSEDEIESYFSGALDPERSVKFFAHQSGGCGPCAIFGADMQTFRSLIEAGVLDSERKEFEVRAVEQREELKRVLERQKSGSGRRGFRSWILSAAAMIAIAGFISFQLLNPADIDPSVTLPGGASYSFEAPTAPALVRDGGDFARGRAAFARAEYHLAAEAFEKVTTSDPMYADAAFFSGVSYLLDDKDVLAVERLTAARDLAIAEGTSGHEAAYYLSLAQIELGQPDQARDMLRSIGSGPYAADAARLLALLGSG